MMPTEHIVYKRERRPDGLLKPLNMFIVIVFWTVQLDVMYYYITKLQLTSNNVGLRTKQNIDLRLQDNEKMVIIIGDPRNSSPERYDTARQRWRHGWLYTE